MIQITRCLLPRYLSVSVHTYHHSRGSVRSLSDSDEVQIQGCETIADTEHSGTPYKNTCVLTSPLTAEANVAIGRAIARNASVSNMSKNGWWFLEVNSWHSIHVNKRCCVHIQPAQSLSQQKSQQNYIAQLEMIRVKGKKKGKKKRN